MIQPTINNAVTIAGGSTGTMLANRYRVVRQLGSGGTGSVWLVEDVKLDNKSFAVKVLLANLMSNKEAALRVLRPIAAALDNAHTKGVVHRDVKPGNVMIAKDGTPYILDFGIAREIQETMTRVTGKLSSGTLMYMSPEQHNGARAASAGRTAFRRGRDHGGPCEESGGPTANMYGRAGRRASSAKRDGNAD